MGLNERIASLPPEMQTEVADFVEYLHQKRVRQQQTPDIDKSLTAVKQLKGLGKEIWQETSADQYVDELRQDW